MYSAFKLPTIEYKYIRIKNFPQQLENIKIVHLSDIHISSILSEEYVNNLVNKVNELKPDLFLFTGDIGDGDPQTVEFLMAL